MEHGAYGLKIGEFGYKNYDLSVFLLYILFIFSHFISLVKRKYFYLFYYFGSVQLNF